MHNAIHSLCCCWADAVSEKWSGSSCQTRLGQSWNQKPCLLTVTVFSFSSSHVLQKFNPKSLRVLLGGHTIQMKRLMHKNWIKWICQGMKPSILGVHSGSWWVDAVIVYCNWKVGNLSFSSVTNHLNDVWYFHRDGFKAPPEVVVPSTRIKLILGHWRDSLSDFVLEYWCQNSPEKQDCN